MRTQVGKVELQVNGKWSVSFESFRGEIGNEYLSAEITSAAVFETENDAYAGGNRALSCLQDTGHFPNMCKLF